MVAAERGRTVRLSRLSENRLKAAQLPFPGLGALPNAIPGNPDQLRSAPLRIAFSFWIDMLNHRNLLPHTYDFSVFEKAVEDIAARYLPAMASSHEFFVSKNAP